MGRKPRLYQGQDMNSVSRFTSLLAVALAIPAHGASTPSTLPADAIPVEELTVLEEVRVRGKLVANAVITVENRVYRLYNKLNRNNRYDVHCIDMHRLDRESLALQRTCLPEFLGYYAAAPLGYGGYTPPSAFSNYSEAPMVCGNPCYSPLSFSSPAFSYRSAPMASFTALPSATPAVMVSATQRTEYADNVLQVINSDPELHDMAAELVGMYQEMDRVKGHYVKLRQEWQAERAAKTSAARERARAQGRKLRPTNPRAP
jgi:hypothetical protein